MEDGDGVYYSAVNRRSRVGKKAAVGILGLAALLGGAAYLVTGFFMDSGGRTVNPGPVALAPITPGETASPIVPELGPPSRGPVAGTKSAVRRLSRPSPVPSPSVMRDEDVAAAQVSRLLQAPRATAASVAAAASGPVTVVNETGPDGSVIRVVSARHDLTERWKLLWVADTGQPVGAGRCTQNFRVDGEPIATRPGLLLCWRTSADRSVVTVATNANGRPSAAVSAMVIDRAWLSLG